MARLPIDVERLLVSPYPDEVGAPAPEVLSRVPTHDAEVLDLRCDLSWNADAFLCLAIDPHWLRLPPTETWPTLVIRLPDLRSVELKGYAAVRDIRRTVAALSLSNGLLSLIDSLGGETVLLFGGPASAWLVPPAMPR